MMIKFSARVQLAATVGLAALAFAAASHAQTAGVTPSGKGEEATQVGEVIVTAQKRRENVQEVPIAISVVGAQTLQASGVNNAESLQQVVPSLTFKKGTTNVNSTLSIRGIGTQSFASGAEPSVSTVIDGVVLGRSGQAFSEFSDIDHIEVLRGPQGTLFGKNASAGVVSILTRAPSKTFDGDAAVAVYEGSEIHTNLDISGPITDKIGFRLSGVYATYDGNIKNYTDNSQTNGFTHTGVRGKIVADLTESLRLTVSADYTHAHDDCCADVLGQYVPSAQLTNVFIPSLSPVVPNYRNMSVRNDLTPLTLDTNSGVSAQLDWNFGDGYTLTSIGAFRTWRNKQIRDGDFHDTYANYVAGMDILQHDNGSLDFRQFSEEIRLASPTHRFFEYVVGAFFWHTDEDDVFTRTDYQCTASTLPVNGTGFAPCRPGASTFLSTAGTANFNTQFDSQAVFGQGTINASDRLRFILGGRYTHDEVSYTFARVDKPVSGPGIGAPFASTGDTTDDGFSARVGVQYDLTPHMVSYATYSRGYKGPAFNVFFNQAAINTAPIPPETSDAYELGLKSQFFDRRLTANAAFFYETFDGFQANNFVNVNGSVTTSLTNAGSVRSTGLELDLSYRASDALTVTGGYAYTSALIDQYNCPAGLTAAQLVTCNAHNGKTLPFAPQHKGNVTANYLLPFSKKAPFDFRFITTYVYTSKTNFDIDQTPLARQPAYGLWDATLQIATKDDKYRLSLIGRNLLDKYYTTFITPSGNGVAAGSYTRLQVPRDAERYVGAALAVSF